MIIYFYWLLVVVVIFLVLFGIGVCMGKWKLVFIIVVVIWLFSILFYYFWLEQIFVKCFGGIMNVIVEEGYQYVVVIWKGDNLWIENYDLEINCCIFQEYLWGNVLEGKVVIKNCNFLCVGNILVLVDMLDKGL